MSKLVICFFPLVICLRYIWKWKQIIFFFCNSPLNYSYYISLLSWLLHIPVHPQESSAHCLSHSPLQEAYLGTQSCRLAELEFRIGVSNNASREKIKTKNQRRGWSATADHFSLGQCSKVASLHQSAFDHWSVTSIPG